GQRQPGILPAPAADGGQPMIEHIVVFGAGAIGSVYAVKLAARHDVTVIARREHVAAIGANGLRLTGCEEITRPVKATTELDAIEPGTLIVLTTKVNGNGAAAAALAGKVRSDTAIVCVQNGLGGEDIVRNGIAGRCLVLRAITHFGAIFRTPGVVEFKVAGYTLIEPGPRSAEIAGLFTESGLDGRVS